MKFKVIQSKLKTSIVSNVVASAILLTAIPSLSHARDQIQIVGSSTVYPFSTIVAERLGNQGQFKTPVVESTGTGGGMKLFCKGVGESTPDIANARGLSNASFIAP